MVETFSYHPPRYTPGCYRDCRFCGGRGCAACDSEAKKDFKKFADENPPVSFKTDTTDGINEMKRFVAGLIGDAGAEQLAEICQRVNKQAENKE
jgi:hypothetical protein